jgi:integrase
MLAFFGDVPITEISPSRVSAYKVHLRKKGLAPATINLHRGFLRHAFKKAVREWEWVSENPVEKVPGEKINNARDRWLTLDEEKRLIDACVIYATGKGNVMVAHYWLQEIVVFALNVGMRQDEILSLSWPDVDLFRRTATVMKSKNGEKRTIPLNRKAFAVLKAKARGREITKGYVFASEVGTKILARNLHRAFCDAKGRAEIEDFRFHDLRHTFATRLVQAGVDLYKVAKLLGHKDIKMTQRYSHHYPESLRAGVEVLDGLEPGKSTNPAQSQEKGLRENP